MLYPASFQVLPDLFQLFALLVKLSTILQVLQHEDKLLIQGVINRELCQAQARTRLFRNSENINIGIRMFTAVEIMVPRLQ
jgi:hypothetical protein